jgi:hypothetical protein
VNEAAMAALTNAAAASAVATITKALARRRRWTGRDMDLLLQSIYDL